MNMVLGLPPSEPLNERFEASRIESVYFINNLGSFYFILIVYFTLYIVSVVVMSCKCCSKRKCVKKLDRKLQRKLFCDDIYVVVRESFQMVSLCAYMAFFYKFSLESKGYNVQNISAMVTCLFYLIVPSIVFSNVMCKYNMVENS